MTVRAGASGLPDDGREITAMHQIIVENLVKTFRVSERAAGLWGAVRGVVHRRHRTVRALDGVSFALDAGELIGYIGPNGAGKSTTVKTLAGILVPDGGRCEVQGRVPWRDRVAFTGFAGWTFVAPEYFGVLEIPIVRGRDFTDRGTAGSPGVVIINQEMARRFWPTGDPLNDHLIIGKGMRREYDDEPLRRIVGIVGNVRDTGLTRPARPAMYVPIAQEPDGVTALNVRLLPLVWMARTATPPLTAAAAIEKALQDVSGLPVTRIRSMDQVVAESTARSRFDMWLMTVFGGSALLLSAIGVYGLMAYSVQQRTAEIGVRMALGADRHRVRMMVLRQGMTLAASGITVGLVSALSFARLLSGFLFGVTSTDSAAFATVAVLLAGVAFVAVWLPAQRATRLDPVTALHEE